MKRVVLGEWLPYPKASVFGNVGPITLSISARWLDIDWTNIFASQNKGNVIVLHPPHPLPTPHTHTHAHTRTATFACFYIKSKHACGILVYTDCRLLKSQFDPSCSLSSSTIFHMNQKVQPNASIHPATQNGDENFFFKGPTRCQLPALFFLGQAFYGCILKFTFRQTVQQDCDIRTGGGSKHLPVMVNSYVVNVYNAVQLYCLERSKVTSPSARNTYPFFTINFSLCGG